jgi:hypothetical protein
VGNLDYLEASGLINFEKILLVYEVLSDVKRWQRECKDFKIKLPDKVPSSPSRHACHELCLTPTPHRSTGGR